MATFTENRFPTLNAAAFLKATTMVGPGLRDALWVQGCTLGCPGCANQSFLPHEPRRELTVERLLAHFATRRGRIDGLSVLGGEPTEQPEAVGALLQGVRALGFSTVVFTGRLYEQLQRQPRYATLLAHTDLLIDGPFVERSASPDLAWRGSTNQRLLRLSDRFGEVDLQAPRANGEVLISQEMILLHGIGTRQLLAAVRHDPPDSSAPKVSLLKAETAHSLRTELNEERDRHGDTQDEQGPSEVQTPILGSQLARLRDRTSSPGRCHHMAEPGSDPGLDALATGRRG